MTEHRVERLQELIKEELGSILQREIKDPRVGCASITAVRVSNDKSHVKIYVSVLGDEQQKQDTMAGLESAKGFIRREIGRWVRLRHTPRFTFTGYLLGRGYARHFSLNQINTQKEDQT